MIGLALIKLFSKGTKTLQELFSFYNFLLNSIKSYEIKNFFNFVIDFLPNS
jgi:hypothetical protein